MTFLFWVMTSFTVVGFIVLMSMKKSMEKRIALAIEHEQNLELKRRVTKPVIWWIVGATMWGIISMMFVVWTFTVSS